MHISWPAYKEKQQNEVVMRRQIQEIRSPHPSKDTYDGPKVFIVPGNGSRNGKSLMISRNEIERFKPHNSTAESEESI